MDKDVYYKVVENRQEYKGVRYFKFNTFSESVIQVVFNTGQEKKGKNATFGVYLIHRLTFLSNYLSINYV